MDVNRDVAKAALSLNKLQRQLWYLSEELVTLALFDPLVMVEEKRQIVISLHTKVGDESPASEVPNTTQPSHLWTPTARHGINQHTMLLPDAGLSRRLPRH